MSKDFLPGLITLVDEEGVEREFEILDVIENEKGCFYALIPNFASPDESIDFDGTYFIFEVVNENGEEQLAEVEDDNLLDELAEIFESHFEELYEDGEEG